MEFHTLYLSGAPGALTVNAHISILIGEHRAFFAGC